VAKCFNGKVMSTMGNQAVLDEFKDFMGGGKDFTKA
jgi:hypothetical protein